MSSGDRLELRDLLLDAPVGVLESEKLAPQPIRIDLDVELSLQAAGTRSIEVTKSGVATAAVLVSG